MYCYNCMKEIKGNGNYCSHCGKAIHEDDFPHHLKPGTILRNQYLAGNSIGEGGFGITYIGLDLSLDIKIAIKEFYPSGYANRNNTVSNKVTLNYHNEGEYFKNGREHFLQEAKSIAKFHRETSIVDVMAFFEENDTAYIIMEYLDGNNLSEKISKDGKFDAVELFKLFIPMMKSLDKMHKVDIIHRDISPENIRILSDGTLKLMDFGSARYFAGIDKKTMSVQFKPGYAPFEQYNKNGNQGPWTDVYGLCATIYKCITGVTPVDSLERYQNDSLKKPSELGVIIPTSLEQILMYGLAIYPDNRCKSMEELLRITESALRNEEVVLKNQTNTTDIDDIYRTRIADEQYKTMFADGAQSASNYADNLYQNSNMPNANQQNTVGNTSARNQKRSKSGLFVGIVVALSVVLAISVGSVLFILSNINNKSSDETDNTTASKVSQVEETTTKETEPKTITMKNFKNKKLSEAKKWLKENGLKYTVTKQIDSNVKKGYIISQNANSGEKINQDKIIELSVSEGEYGQKVIVTASKGDSDATLKMLEWDYISSSWTELFHCKAVVGDGGISSKFGEENYYTPKGTFPIGKLIYGEEDVETNLDTYYADSDTVISSDPTHSYNLIVSSNYGLSEYDPIGQRLNGGTDYERNNALIFIEHNGDGENPKRVESTERGSSITICGRYGLDSTTGGCIDIKAEKMVKLAGLLDADLDPCIITKVK